jgi:hypothetical protein
MSLLRYKRHAPEDLSSDVSFHMSFLDSPQRASAWSLSPLKMLPLVPPLIPLEPVPSLVPLPEWARRPAPVLPQARSRAGREQKTARAKAAEKKRDKELEAAEEDLERAASEDFGVPASKKKRRIRASEKARESAAVLVAVAEALAEEHESQLGEAEVKQEKLQGDEEMEMVEAKPARRSRKRDVSESEYGLPPNKAKRRPKASVKALAAAEEARRRAAAKPPPMMVVAPAPGAPPMLVETGPKPRGRRMTGVNRAVLLQWYLERDGLNCSPTTEEKESLSAASGLTVKQVDYFLWNRRKRERERGRLEGVPLPGRASKRLAEPGVKEEAGAAAAAPEEMVLPEPEIKSEPLLEEPPME